MLLERLIQKGAAFAERRSRRAIAALARIDLPTGVMVDRDDQGIAISGKDLRRRMISDIRLRSFADAVKRDLR
jgi:hypothetical protein